MFFIKVAGQGRMIFSHIFEKYNEALSGDLYHIEGFIIDQRCGVAGNFQISDLKEVTFTVDAVNGTTAWLSIESEDYRTVPDVGDWIWVRLKDTNGTIEKLQIIDVQYDTFIYTNDDATSYIQNKHNTATIVAQDWNTDNYINNGDTVTLGGLTEATDNDDYEVVSITKPAADTIFVLKNIADDTLVMTPEDPLTTDFTISKSIEVTGEAVGGDPASSRVYAKQNKITVMANTTIVSDGIIQAGDSIVIANTTNNNSADNTTNAYETVASNPEYLNVGETDSVIYIHNTTLADDMTTETLDGTDETITIVKDIETTATGSVYFSNQNSIDINYTGDVPEIVSYLGVGESVVLANSNHNDGTYTVASVDDTQSGVIHIHVTEAITAPTESVGAGGTLTITDDVIYTNTNPSSEVVEKITEIMIYDEDLTSSLDIGDEFILTGTSGGTQDGTYTVKTTPIYAGGATTIRVTNSKQFTAGENFYNTETATLTFTASQVVYTGFTDDSEAVDATTLKVNKDLTDYLSIGNVFDITGTTSNNLTDLEIETIDWNNTNVGYTTIVLTAASDDLTAETLVGATITAKNVDIIYTANEPQSLIYSNKRTLLTGDPIEEWEYKIGVGSEIIADHTIKIVGLDLTDLGFTTGDRLTLSGFTGANNKSVTITTVNYTEPVGEVLGYSTIVVSEILVNENINVGTEVIIKNNRIELVGLDVFPHITLGDSVLISGSNTADGSFHVLYLEYILGNSIMWICDCVSIPLAEYPYPFCVRTPVEVTIDTPYKKYYAVAGDEIVKSKSTIKAPLVDLTAHPYINNTTLNDILLYDGDETYTSLTIESLTYDDDEGGENPFTDITVLEHLTAGDITGYSLVAPDRTLVLTNPRLNSNVDAETRTISIIGTLEELTEYINYFEIGTTFTVANTTDGLNDGTYTISSIDVSQIDVSDYRYGFTVEYDEENLLVDEASLPLITTLTIDDPVDIAISIGTDPSISVASAKIIFYGRNITAHLLDAGGFELVGTTQDGTYITTAFSSGDDTIINIDEAVVGTLVNEDLPVGTSYIKITPLTEYFTYTNTSDESGIDILTYANIKWHGADLTPYISKNETITLSRFGIPTNDGVKNIVNEDGAVSYADGITTLWIVENLDAEILDDLITPATITQENDIVCTVGSDDVTSFYATKSTEYLTWNAGIDLTTVKPYFLTGDIIEVYNSSDELITTVEIDTATYNDPDMEIVFTDTSAITETYPYGLSDNFTLISTDKSVTYTNTDATSAITTEIDRITLDREVMPGNGVFLHDGFITIDTGDNAGTYAVGDFTYTDFNITSSIVTPDTIIIVREDLREYLKPGHKITLSGFLAVNNNGIFTIGTITYGAGDTTITTIEQTLTNETLNVGTETITKYGWTYGERGVGITEIILDPTTDAWSLVDETLDIADTISYNGTYTYTEANGTDSAVTSADDFLLFKGVVYTDDIMKEFLVGDTITLANLSENTAFDGVDLEIDTIATVGVDTKITFVEDDNYNKWDFVAETLDDVGAGTAVTMTTIDESEAVLTVGNPEGIFGGTEDTMASFMITMPSTATPETIKITNIDMNTNIMYIQSISDDNPPA